MSTNCRRIRVIKTAELLSRLYKCLVELGELVKVLVGVLQSGEWSISEWLIR